MDGLSASLILRQDRESMQSMRSRKLKVVEFIAVHVHSCSSGKLISCYDFKLTRR